jgi:hypothetical protein
LYILYSISSISCCAPSSTLHVVRRTRIWHHYIQSQIKCTWLFTCATATTICILWCILHVIDIVCTLSIWVFLYNKFQLEFQFECVDGEPCCPWTTWLLTSWVYWTRKDFWTTPTYSIPPTTDSISVCWLILHMISKHSIHLYVHINDDNLWISFMWFRF